MSISNLLDQGEASQSWVNLRVNSLQIDSDLILSPSAQNVLGLSVTSQFSIGATGQALSSSNLSALTASDIAPVGISYSGINITVQETGYYLFDFQLQFQINIFSASENFSIQLWDDTSSFVVIANDYRIIDGDSHSLQLNRLVKLTQGHNYQILINQQNAQDVIIKADNLSFLSIIKLF